MRTRQLFGGISISVEGIFHDVVAHDAERMDENLTRESGQSEAAPDFTAVENECALRRACLVFSFRHNAAEAVIEPAPEPDILCAIAAPIIGRDKPGMVAILIAEKNEVGGEIERR